MGQSRVPAPPDRITGVIFPPAPFFAAIILSRPPAQSVRARTLIPELYRFHNAAGRSRRALQDAAGEAEPPGMVHHGEGDDRQQDRAVAGLDRAVAGGEGEGAEIEGEE